jgi:hypothetical protein
MALLLGITEAVAGDSVSDAGFGGWFDRAVMAGWAGSIPSALLLSCSPLTAGSPGAVVSTWVVGAKACAEDEGPWTMATRTFAEMGRGP